MNLNSDARYGRFKLDVLEVTFYEHVARILKCRVLKGRQVVHFFLLSMLLLWVANQKIKRLLGRFGVINI